MCGKTSEFYKMVFDENVFSRWTPGLFPWGKAAGAWR